MQAVLVGAIVVAACVLVVSAVMLTFDAIMFNK